MGSQALDGSPVLFLGIRVVFNDDTACDTVCGTKELKKSHTPGTMLVTTQELAGGGISSWL